MIPEAKDKINIVVQTVAGTTWKKVLLGLLVVGAVGMVIFVQTCRYKNAASNLDVVANKQALVQEQVRIEKEYIQPKLQAMPPTQTCIVMANAWEVK